MCSTEKLEWGLVIATYKREAILPRCLRLAAQQTVSPKEIIVVDASPYWEKTRAKIMQELAVKYPAIEWKYVQAERASSATQRNQGIDLATADVLFLIDDDTLIYPDCAEEIMNIYTHDIAHQVVGIRGTPAQLPPDKPVQKLDNKQLSKFKDKTKIILYKLRKVVGNAVDLVVMNPKEDFIPYDFCSFSQQPLPEEIKNLAVCQVPIMQGAYMTFRRRIIKRARFEDILVRYATSEDTDACCRASRFGMMLHALKAQMWHSPISHRVVSRYTFTVMRALNIAVLHKLHSIDVTRSKKLIVKFFWRRLVDATIRDILTLRWSLPSTRGYLFAYRYYDKIFSMNPEELRAWYPGFQQILFDKDGS